MMNDDSYPVMYFTSIPPLLNNHGRIGKPAIRPFRARQPTARIYGSSKKRALFFFLSREASGVILAPVLLRWRAVWISRGRVVSVPWIVKHSHFRR